MILLHLKFCVNSLIFGLLLDFIMSKTKSKLSHKSAEQAFSKGKNEPSQLSQSSNNHLPWVIAILVICGILYYQTRYYDFVNWDDDRNVFENELVKELDWQHVKGIFTSSVIGNYNPLPIFTFAVEHHFFGMNPNVMHITNLILHLICVFFVFQFMRLLQLPPWLAAFAALLFGIHPMHVESVAWITERKDVLYAAFFLPALNMYIKDKLAGVHSRTFWILILFVVGLFAKIQMVSLPLSMIAVDYLLEKDFNLIKSVLSKWLFLAIAFLFGVIGIIVLKDQGSLETNTTFSLFERLFIGSYSLLTYLIKFFVPYQLLPLYPYPEKLTIWHYISMPVALISFFGIWWLYKKKVKQIVFGFMFFFFNVVFLLQILGAGQGYIADRFTYVAYIGLLFIVVYYLQRWIEEQRLGLNLAYACVGLISLSSFVVSFRQVKIWKNSDTLWTHVIKNNISTSLPYNNRANYFRDLKQYDKALADYNKAIELKAGHSTYNSRAKLFFIKNEDQKAIQDYTIAIERMPKAEYYVNRGAAYAKLGNVDLALKDLNKGLELDPSWKVGYLNRSIMYNMQGNFDLALKDIDSYLRYEPKNSDLWYEGARCLRALNRANDAITYYNRAIQINSKVGLYFLERGRTFKSLGNETSAQSDFSAALSLGIKPEEINR